MIRKNESSYRVWPYKRYCFLFEICAMRITLKSILIVTLWVRVFRFFPGRNLKITPWKITKGVRLLWRYENYGMCVTAVSTWGEVCLVISCNTSLVSTGRRYTPTTPHPSPVMWVTLTRQGMDVYMYVCACVCMCVASLWQDMYRPR